MFPISTSSSTTNRRAFPISSLQLYVRRLQLASILRVAAHGFNMLLSHFSLERTESTQAKSVFLCHCTNFFHAFSCKMFTQCIILEASFQCQGNCLSHTGICLSRRETKVKMEINGARNVNHSAVYY